MGPLTRNGIGACGVVLLLLLFHWGQDVFTRWADAPRVELQCDARPTEKMWGSVEKCWVSEGYQPDPPDRCLCVKVGLGWNWHQWVLPLNALVAALIATGAVFLFAGRLFTRLLVLNGSIFAGFLAMAAIAFQINRVNESGMFFLAVFVWTGLYCGVATAVFLPLNLWIRGIRGRN
jgi:hypothetical protein